jgi:hypothetical protein
MSTTTVAGRCRTTPRQTPAARHKRALPIAEESVRPMLPVLTKARAAASTKAVTPAWTSALPL